MRKLMSLADEIFTLFVERGDEAYFGEPVSQTEHALQAAFLAEQAGVSDALTVAALLHDIGHLIHGQSEDIAERGVDARHEEAGEVWLSHRVGPEITEPVKLHVAAKRYLCAVEPDYLAQLSPASVQSLALQGGPFGPEEQRQFEANPYYREAVLLRRWDDEAKIAGLATPPLEHYRERIERVARVAL
jgi:[1-hydroxy-2-(trimethylamino)ethyl]phosphonate dioxygenase